MTLHLSEPQPIDVSQKLLDLYERRGRAHLLSVIGTSRQTRSPLGTGSSSLRSEDTQCPNPSSQTGSNVS
jgi:hypothetical protein